MRKNGYGQYLERVLRDSGVSMNVRPTAIPDVLWSSRRCSAITRGFFFESFNQKASTRPWEVAVTFVQDNHSRSAQGVLRGLHYQVGSTPQGKLVRVVRGAVFDVAVDIRRDSSTFGRWVGDRAERDEPHAVLDPARASRMASSC